MITLWIFQVEVSSGSRWRGNDDIISLSTSQSVHWVWEENAGTVTLIHAQEGQGLSYSSVDIGCPTISPGPMLYRAAEVSASSYTLDVPHRCSCSLGVCCCPCSPYWRTDRSQVPSCKHLAHSPPGANKRVGKTKIHFANIIRKPSGAKSCGVESSGD